MITRFCSKSKLGIVGFFCGMQLSHAVVYECKSNCLCYNAFHGQRLCDFISFALPVNNKNERQMAENLIEFEKDENAKNSENS